LQIGLSNLLLVFTKQYLLIQKQGQVQSLLTSFSLPPPGMRMFVNIKLPISSGKWWLD